MARVHLCLIRKREELFSDRTDQSFIRASREISSPNRLTKESIEKVETVPYYVLARAAQQAAADLGTPIGTMINWGPVRDGRGNVTDSSITYDIRYFNAISFARFIDGDTEHYANSPVSQISVAR